MWRRGAARTLKAGEYRFAGPMRASDVVDRLVAGSVFLRPVTFPEGLTIAEMAAVFEAAGLGTKAMFTAAARRGSLVHEIDPTADDLEGYLFPETYNLPRDAGAEMLVEQMARRFLAVYDTALRDARADARADDAAGGDDGVADREGDEPARGAAAGVGRLPEPAAHRHGRCSATRR